MLGFLDDLGLHPEDVSEAASVLEVVAERLFIAGDGGAAFADVYGLITREVERDVRSPDGSFLEPAWISRLAGRFCARYLETLRFHAEDRGQDCAAWGATYALAGAGRASPLQIAVMGLSAHINHDLALGIHATIVESGHAGDPRMLARYLHDHDRVNALLRRTIPAAFELLIRRHRCRAAAAVWRFMRPVVCSGVMRILRAWRARVWRDVLSLLAAVTDAERAAVAGRIERRAARAAWLLALPLGRSLWRAGAPQGPGGPRAI